MKKVRTWWLPEKEEHLVKYIERDDNYQAKLRGHALRFVSNFTVALDIGAHVGLWTRELCARFERVIAFEPVAAHRDCLSKNVPSPNLLISRYALGAADGICLMTNEPESTGHTWVKEFSAEFRSDLRAQPMAADMRALDGLVASVPYDGFLLSPMRVGFMKLDCEGSELWALKGAEETIKLHRPVINIEQKFGINCVVGDAGKYLESLGMRLLGQMSDEYVYGF